MLSAQSKTSAGCRVTLCFCKSQGEKKKKNKNTHRGTLKEIMHPFYFCLRLSLLFPTFSALEMDLLCNRNTEAIEPAVSETLTRAGRQRVPVAWSSDSDQSTVGDHMRGRPCGFSGQRCADGAVLHVPKCHLPPQRPLGSSTMALLLWPHQPEPSPRFLRGSEELPFLDGICACPRL